MKRFGVSNFQLNNVKQNWANLQVSAKELFEKKTGELKMTMSEELEHLVEKANESLLNLNRWLKTQERDLLKSTKAEDSEVEDADVIEVSSKPVFEKTTKKESKESEKTTDDLH